jgi:hypothetical protein
MADLLKKPWIVDLLRAAFESRDQDLNPTTDGSGELSFSNPKKRIVQLLGVGHQHPSAGPLRKLEADIISVILRSKSSNQPR